jgi:hypothetical protein
MNRPLFIHTVPARGHSIPQQNDGPTPYLDRVLAAFPPTDQGPEISGETYETPKIAI